MAFDPCPSAAAQRIETEYRLHFGVKYPVVGNSEYELKFKHKPSFTFIDSITAVQHGEKAASDLISSFKKAAAGSPTFFFDPAGLIPNTNVLVSLGVDTVDITLPTAEFFLHDMQYRLRLPLYVHSPNPNNESNVIDLQAIDANLKDRLSTMEADEHRLELETVIQNPSKSLQEFKKINGLPDFMKNISDDDLRVSEVCMTSRVGFFIMAKVPNADAHILLHGCFDVSRYTTPAMEVPTNRIPRIEIELEAKYFFGNDANLSNEATQKEYVNRIFSEITKASADYKFIPFDKSKMEDAAHSIQQYYASEAPELSQKNSPIGSLCRQKKLNPYFVYALNRGCTIPDIIDSIKEKGKNSPLAQMATYFLPDPTKLLQNNNPFSDREVA